MSILGFCSFQLGWVPDFDCIMKHQVVAACIVYRWHNSLYMCHNIIMILAGCSRMYSLQMVFCILDSNCYFLFLPHTFVYFENSN